MDPVGSPLTGDVQASNPTHRQSILGSFLRVRPRGTSQSQQGPAPNLHLDNSEGVLVDHAIRQQPPPPPPPVVVDMPIQPPSPGPVSAQGHRRRPAAAGGGLQPSVSATHGFNIVSPSATNSAVHGLSQILRRRRSANGALNTSAMGAATSPVEAQNVFHAPSPVANRAAAAPSTNPNPNPNARSHRIRLVPHLDSTRSLHFEPICRDVREGDAALRIGRFTDRSGLGVAALNAQNTNKLAFKSKVVSRAHAEVWCEPGGKFYIRDTKSSSGTFLNHIRLSAPNADSKPFPIKDGDVLQLGVDYQGGTEEIYKCVKMRIELGREWQSQPNAFNTNALKQLKALSAQPSAQSGAPCATKRAGNSLSKSGIADCCICLFAVTVHQSLFIAPCSHVFHYKCIRPMLLMHHPGFSCPLCRTFANLEEDVEIDMDDQELAISVEAAEQENDSSGGSGAEGGARTNANVNGNNANVHAMDVDAINEVSAQANVAGAETEVERDFAPPNVRRRNVFGSTGVGDAAPVNGGTVRNHRQYDHSLSPVRNGAGPGFEGVPEDVDEYASASAGSAEEHEHEREHLRDFLRDHVEMDGTDELRPLPMAVPASNNGGVQSPSMPGSVSASAVSSLVASPPTPGGIGAGSGSSIQRPTSVPITSPSTNPNARVRAAISNSSNSFGMALDERDEGSEGEDESPGLGIGGHQAQARVGMTMGGDGNASGSSGEGGMLGIGIGFGMGTGEKRKR